jgi:predicted NBD/HSP70 family sugar kinase
MASVRVVECGGQGPRRVDVWGMEVINSVKGKWTNNVSHLLNFAQEQLPDVTAAIIFSVAGVIENHKKIIVCPNVHHLDGVNLGCEETSIPLFVCGDMEASVTGMAELFPQLEFFMGLTRSTGLGARFWKDGQIISACEVGHIKVDSSPFAALCGCGKRGCAEAILAGNAIAKFVVGEMWLQNRTIPEDIHPCHWLDICYNKGENWAVRHYQDVLFPGLGVFFADVLSTIRVPAVVLKGTLGLRSFKDITGMKGFIRDQARMKIIDRKWVDELEFYPLTCPQDYDAFIGAAKIALKLLQGL